jgi:hypothetical protein
MNPIHLLALTLLLPAAAALARADKAPVGPLSGEHLATVRAQANSLMRAVENLQEAIIEDLAGRKERDLYRKSDAVLGHLLDLRKALAGKATRQDLYTAFAAMDAQLHDLLENLDSTKEAPQSLRREANRVRHADAELHFALSAGDARPERAAELVKRQAGELLSTARELNRTAQYALVARPGEIAPTVFNRFVEATARLEKSAAAGASSEQLHKDFTAVDTAWQRVTGVLRALKPRENLYLVRSAGEVDRLLDRLHQLLGVKGERSRLIIST